MNDNQITEIIIGCAIKVHRTLGPGLLESAYQECLKIKIYDPPLIPLCLLRVLCGYFLTKETKQILCFYYFAQTGSARSIPRT